MTLCTRVYIHDEVRPQELLNKCNELMGAAPSTKQSDEPHWSGDDGRRQLMNEPNQNLPAWVIVGYRNNAMYQPHDEDHGEDCEPNCTEQHEPSHWVVLSLDTAYSYNDEFGGCSDLHCRLVKAIGLWLTSRGIKWSWRNEYSGKISTGDTGWEDFSKMGNDASEWLKTVVMPALAASMDGAKIC